MSAFFDLEDLADALIAAKEMGWSVNPPPIGDIVPQPTKEMNDAKEI